MASAEHIERDEPQDETWPDPMREWMKDLAEPDHDAMWGARGTFETLDGGDGCCTTCDASGWGGPASGPETNGRCADCRGSGHIFHDGECRHCPECGVRRLVDEVFDEQIGFEEQARPVVVTRLACGHEIVTPSRWRP